MLVEAAAGTGKTTAMIDRIVELLARGEEISRIAAVTFTRKAAAQMRDRLRIVLDREIAAEERPENVRRDLRRARDSMDRAFVATIHSFCSRLLRERPIEAGLDPAFEELEEDDLAWLRDAVWQEHLDEMVLRRPEDLSRLGSLGVELGHLKQGYELLCAYPDVVPAASPVERPRLPEVLRKAEPFLRRAERELSSRDSEAPRDDFVQVLWAAIHRLKTADLSDDLDCARILEILKSAAERRKDVWPEGDDLHATFIELRESAFKPALASWYEYRHPFVLEAVSSAASKFSEERIRRGRLNFTDLLMRASRLLRDHPDVRRYLQDRFRYLFVDEFQDTDPIQAEVMMYLTGRDVNEKDWTRASPRPGSLFVVGDPKQSIYRFRRADLRTYNRVRQIIERSGGRSLSLSTSFRSAPAICDWVNGVFEIVFDGRDEHQARHVPLSPVRSVENPYCGAFRLEVSTGDRWATDDALCEADADQIAGWINGAIRGSVGLSFRAPDGSESVRAAQPGDFLIVLRERGHLHQYGRALEALNIPHEISGGKAFGDSEELRAVLPFLQAVVDPDNPIPLLAFLRSSLCGVDDDALYRFRRDGGSFRYLEKTIEGADPRIEAAFGLLRDARGESRRLPPSVAFARICESLGVLAGAYASPNGETRSGNILKAIFESRRLSIDGLSFAEIVTALEVLMTESAAEEMSIEAGRKNVVQVMNLHRAKGLEAAVVFLAGPIPERSGKGGPQHSIDRMKEIPIGHFLFRYQPPWREHGFDEIARPKGWEALRQLEEGLEAAEDDRLLYVAATRAMNMLVVSSKLYTGAKKPKASFGAWTGLVQLPLKELPSRVEPAPPKERKRESDLAGESKAASEELRKSYGRAAAPSFAATSPSKFEGETVFVERERSGKGMAWGRVVHRLLEALMRNRHAELDLEKYAENLLRDEERPLEELPELLVLIAGVRKSELWKRALSAKECLVEVPFATTVKSMAYGLPDPPEETLLNGAIDLVFKENGIWHVIDYKSDKIAGSVEPLFELYKPQLKCYRDAWQKMTAEPVQAGLYFIDTKDVRWVD